MHPDICYTLDQFYGWPYDDSLGSKYVAVSVIVCNKLMCLTETYIFYELRKHISMTTVKR